MNCGTVLYDDEFQFPNGTTINKLIVVLCNYGSDYLVAQTTRQQKKKTTNIGCQPQNTPHNYYIPAKTAWFEDNTWVLLDEVFEYNSTTFTYKKADRVVTLKHKLPELLIKSILECALVSDDIEGIYLEYIERELKKFN